MSEQPCEESNLTNNVRTEVFLQTILVKIRGHNQDSMCYYRNRITKILHFEKHDTGVQLHRVRNENLVLALFGGMSKKTIEHTCYKIDLNDNFYPAVLFYI